MLGEAQAAAAASDVAVVQRRHEKELRYKNWLEQVTINAVDQALQFQLEESQRDQQGVPESGESQGCSSSNSLCSEPTCCHRRGWTLDRNSEERRIVAARIYSLLVQWKPDLSFEWRARVASAVHIFERALYREAKSKEEYLNTLMLDLQLRQILRQFEAGTGPSLLKTNCSEDDATQHSTRRPLRKSVSFNSTLTEPPRQPLASFHSTPVEPIRQPVPLGALMRMHDDARFADGDRILAEALNDVELLNGISEEQSSPSVERDHLRKEEADSCLWEAILSGNLRDMEENLVRHRDYASKRVVKRAIRMLSKRKREEEKKIEAELRRAMLAPSVETLVEVISRARSEFVDELKDLCNDAEVVLHRLLEESVRDDSPASPGVSGDRVRAADSSRETENVEVVSSPAQTAMVTSPPTQQHRQFNGIKFRRSVTFSCDNRTGPISPLRNESNITVDTGEPERSPQVSQSPCDVARAAERSTESSVFAIGHMMTPLRTVPRRGTPPRPLGALLGWVPPNRSVFSERQQSPPTRHQAPGDRISSISSSPSETAIPNPSDLAQLVVPADSANDTAVDAVSSSSTAAENNSTEVPRISLLALLHQGGDPDAVFVMNRRRLSPGFRSETGSIAEELTQEMIDGGMDPICCVCMVEKKGAAFIPCGHTFCRTCTRELRKGRGKCPLCNKSIQDVLKIY